MPKVDTGASDPFALWLAARCWCNREPSLLASDCQYVTMSWWWQLGHSSGGADGVRPRITQWLIHAMGGCWGLSTLLCTVVVNRFHYTQNVLILSQADDVLIFGIPSGRSPQYWFSCVRPSHQCYQYMRILFIFILCFQYVLVYTGFSIKNSRGIHFNRWL